MKKYKIGLIAILAIGISQSCKKRESIGLPSSKIEGISSKWELFRVDQIDVNNKFAFVESDSLLNVTKAILKNGTPLELSFTAAGEFKVENTGEGSKFFAIKEGKWAFDRSDAPSFVRIKSTSTTDSTDFILSRPIRTVDPYLVIKRNVMCSGKRINAYQYWFRRK